MNQETFKLEELAEKAGVSARTVRYYVQRGLLPAPAFRGKDTAYDAEHLLRLRAIRQLQQGFLPLDAIQERLQGCSLAELEAIAEGTAPEPEPVTPKAPPAPAPAAREQIAKRAPGVGAGTPAVPPTAATRWSRTTLRPGLELHLAADADEETRRLFQQLLDHALSPAAPRAPGKRPPGRTGGTRE